MSIIELQRRIAEVGRLRIGEQVVASNGKTRPAKLETWRITSSDRQRINHIAELYGGEVREWQAPAGRQWEVVTESDSLPVIVPPSQMAFSQHMELWSAGGCLRRCDGAVESISDHPCLCDPDNRECSIHTRLSVLLRDVPGLGVYRLDTSGFYAAVELQGAVEIIQTAAGRGAMLPARLRLEQRTVKRPGADGKPQTRNFAVPVLDIEVTPAQLMGGAAGLVELGAAPAERQTAFTPVPAALPEGPNRSIADQSAPPPPKPTRRNAAPEIPRSGRQRGGPATEEPDWDGLLTEHEGDVGELWNLRVLAKGMWPNDGALLNRIAQAWQRAKDAEGRTAAATQPPQPEPSQPTDKQLKHLFALLGEREIKSKDARLRFANHALDRDDLTSYGQLTGEDVSGLIDLLKQTAAPDTAPDGGGENPDG